MLRWLFSILIAAPFALLIVLFAVSNRQTVEIGLFPLPFTLETPLYLLVLAMLGAGVLCGAVLAWLSGHRARATARSASKNAQRLEKELAEVRAAALRPDMTAEPTAITGKANLPALTL